MHTKSGPSLQNSLTIVYCGGQANPQIKAIFQRFYFQAANLEMFPYIKVLTLYIYQ